MILAARYTVTLFGLRPGQELTPVSAPLHTTVLLLAVVGLLVLFVPCYLGIRLGTRFASVLGVFSLVPLTLLVFLPFFRPGALHWGNLAAPAPGGGFTFYMSWVFIMTWSVLATEAAACYIGECRQPARDDWAGRGVSSSADLGVQLP